MVNLAKGGAKDSEMAQLVQGLVAEVGDLSLIPGIHLLEGENSRKLSADLSLCAVSRCKCGCTIKANVSSFARP